MSRPKRKILASAGRDPNSADAPEGWWHQLERFETEEKARAEDRKRLDGARLVTMATFYCDDLDLVWAPLPGVTEVQLLELIDCLEVEELSPANSSLASAVRMREVRMSLIESVLELFAEYPTEELAVATVIKTTWSVTPDRLMAKTAAAIKNQFLTDLKRSGIASLPGPFVANLHGEYEPTAGLFVLHWHVVTTAEKAEALHRLKDPRTRRKGYTKTHTGADPIRVDKVKDRIRQVSYLLKSFWPQKTVRDGVRDKDGVRVDEPYHTLYLVWLDQQRLQDITIMNGVWSRRKGGTEVGKRLYFKVFG